MRYAYNILYNLLPPRERSQSDPLFNLIFSFNFLRRILIAGMIGTVLICVPQKDISQFGTLLLWIVTSLVVGIAIGFLFGFPRSGRPKTENGKNELIANSNSAARPNTNLEEISDWLTKIIVGLSLVNANSIGRTISSIADKIAHSMNPQVTTANQAVGFAIVVGFPTIGFLYGYFYTRLFLQRAFIDSDNRIDSRVDEIVNTAARQVSVSTSPTLPSKIEIKNAEHIAEIVPSGNTNVIANKIKELAASYEKIRYEMPSGDQRTRRMTEIASSMRQLGQAAFPMLSELSKSYLVGERLAAVCILQMVFDPEYINWLAERVSDEKPFLAYHAASALYGRMLDANKEERTLIYQAIENAKSKLTYPESGRDGVINRIINFYNEA